MSLTDQLLEWTTASAMNFDYKILLGSLEFLSYL